MNLVKGKQYQVVRSDAHLSWIASSGGAWQGRSMRLSIGDILTYLGTNVGKYKTPEDTFRLENGRGMVGTFAPEIRGRADVSYLEEVDGFSMQKVAREIVKIAKMLSGGNSLRLMQQLKSDLHISWVKDGNDFDGGGAILWSGEGANIVVDGMKVSAFDSYGSYPEYDMGVHQKLVDWSKKHGIYWEAYDAGTYLAYRS